MYLCVPDWIGIIIGNALLFFEKRGKGENQQQTQSTFDVNIRIWTQAKLVGDECSYHFLTYIIHTISLLGKSLILSWSMDKGMYV